MTTALTEIQIDQIIVICGKMVDQIPAILGLFATLFLILRQYLNNKAAKETREKVIEKLDEASGKLDENTELTKIVKTALTDADQLRNLTTNGSKINNGNPTYYQVKLPGEAYETFALAEGGPTWWKSEKCEKGRTVRFRTDAASVMGFHFHQVTEILSGVTGVLFYEVDHKTVIITPGISYTCPADAVHSARFDAPGEALVHWPEQETDILTIGVFNDP